MTNYSQMGWAQVIPGVDNLPLEEIDKLKKEFARHLLLFPDNPYKCAVATFPDKNDNEFYSRVVARWANDNKVIMYTIQLLNEKGEGTFLPTKDAFALDVLRMSRDKNLSKAQQFQALKLFADIMGYVAKPDTKVNVGVNVNSGVMLMPYVKPEDKVEFEKMAIEQQRMMVEENTKH